MIPMRLLGYFCLKHQQSGLGCEYLDRINIVQSFTGKIISPLSKYQDCVDSRQIRIFFSTLHHMSIFISNHFLSIFIEMCFKKNSFFPYILKKNLLFHIFPSLKELCERFLILDVRLSPAMAACRALSSAHLSQLLCFEKFNSLFDLSFLWKRRRWRGKRQV